MAKPTFVESSFEVDEEDNYEEREESEISHDELEKVIDLGCVRISDEGDLSPLEWMAASMTPVDPEGKVKKQIITEGTTQVGSDAYVYFHYNAYVDFKEIPFDSTYLRQAPQSAILGEHSMIPGIEIALLSMKIGETSKFIIDYSLAYGELGFPPRVPPKSTILIVIDLLSCFNFGGIDFEGDETEKKLLEASTYCDIGKECFSMKMTFGAINHYQKAISTLTKMQNNSSQWKALYLKASLNLMVCLNKNRKKSPKTVKKIAQEVVKMVPNLAREHAKFFYHLGKAHLDSMNHDKALMCFKKAHELKPSDNLIFQEMRKLQKQVEKSREDENDFCARALGIKKDEPYSEEKETQKMLREQIERFAASKNVTIKLPMGLTDSEVSYIKKLSSEMKINLTKQRENYFITKTKD